MNATAVLFCAWLVVLSSFSTAQGKWIFNFTRSLYVATMPENARGRVYAVPQNGKMGVYLPHDVSPYANVGATKFGAKLGKSSENGTLPHGQQPQHHHHQLVRFKIVSGDKHNFFKAESEIIGNFAYLRIRTRQSLDVDLNRDLTPEYSLRVKAIYRRQSLNFGSGGVGGRNLETRAEVLLKITDQNDLSPVFLPDHYQAKINRRFPVFSSIIRVSAVDADYGLNGEIYYQLLNRTDYFSIHPTSGVVNLLRSLDDFPIDNITLSVAAVDRASRLFSDSRSNQGLASTASIHIRISQSPPEAHGRHWTLFTASNSQDGKFNQCGLAADSVCAILSFPDSSLVPDRLEIGKIASDDTVSLFYLHRVYNRARKEVNFEVRSVSSVQFGTYSFTLLPIGANISLNITSKADELCNVDTIDIWLNKTQFIFEVPEWAPSGYLLGRIRLHEASGLTRFELRRLDDEKEANLPFYITQETGMLYLHRPKNGTLALDVKRRPEYRFFVHIRRVQCRNEKEEKRQVTVKVKDCNDHQPRFVDNCSVVNLDYDRPKSDDHSLLICVLKAVDDDLDDNGRISYDLLDHQTTPVSVFTNIVDEYFYIDHNEGELILKNATAFLEADKKSGGKSYTLTVRASDHGWPLRRYSDKTVIVSSATSSGSAVAKSSRRRKDTLDNRHSPRVQSEWNFEIREDALFGQRVGKINAHDSDPGYSGVLLFTISDDRTNWEVISGDQTNSEVITERPFNIDLYNGTLFVYGALDRELRPEYKFRVSVRDLGMPARSVFTKVNVKVLDVNDNNPRFEREAYRVRVNENAAPGTSVLQLKANDEDLGENGRVRYTMVTRTPYFNLDAVTGILSLVAELDREKVDTHRLLVQAQDHGQPPLSALVNVTVIVDDVNDNAPSCRSDRLKAYVPEDYPSGALVTCLDAYDPDVGENGRISFRLVGGASSSSTNSLDDTPFLIDPSTGCIRLGKSTPDMATTDTAITNLKQSKETPYYLDLLLDYERQPFYNLTVELTDFGSPRSLKSQCHVFVEVVDVNENRYPPKFVGLDDHGDDHDQFAVEAEVYENEPASTFVKQLKTVDPDAAVTMVDPKPIYSITDGDGLGVFTIDQEGRIFTLRSLDRETKPFYWLTVMAQDRAAASLSSTIDVFVRVLDRNDNPPTPSKPIYYASVMENSPPNVVMLRIEATDLDSLIDPIPFVEGDEEKEDDEEQELEPPVKTYNLEMSPSRPLTFKISRGDPQSFFKMDPTTGYLSTHRRSVDRETTPELELEVSISDNGEPEPLISNVLVVVRVEDENDNAPVFPTKRMNFEIPERNKPRRGRNKGRNEASKFLCRIFASDEDEGKNGEIRYSIVEGNEHNLVKMDEETGSVYAMDNATWNSSQSIILKVRATDRGTPPKYSERHVHLTPITLGVGGKAFDTKSISITSNLVSSPLHVATSDPIGHRVGILEASISSMDEAPRIWFYMLSGDNDNAFALRSDTGVVLLAKRPTLPTYNLTFMATVDGINGVTGQATIIVQQQGDDERPQFSTDRIHIRVPENQRTNSVLLKLSDHLKLTNGHEEIRFFIAESYYNHRGVMQTDGVFQADPKSGVVYLKNTLDREHRAHYSFKVGARSRRGKRGYALVDIQVSDVNDNAPKFVNRHTNLRLSQSTSPGSVIHYLAAYDGDEGANGRLTYSLTLDSYKGTFSVDAQTGAVRLTRSLLTSDTKSIFVLSVKVEDGGRPPLLDTADVRISLIPNGQGTDSATTIGVKFTQELYTFEVTGKLNHGVYVGTAQADGGSSLEYCIEEDQGGYFDIHPLTGAVTLKRPLDLEHSSTAEGKVCVRSSAVVNAVTAAADTARLVITLRDGNDHAPVFNQVYYEADLEENLPIGTVVLVVNATDMDAGQAGVVTYHIADQWANRYFQIDYHTGAIRLLRPLDYENEYERKFVFHVAAEDLGDPKMYTVTPAMVEIRVLDVNDQAPVFERSNYNFTLYAPAVPGLVVGMVWAKDVDTIGSVKYSILDAAIDTEKHLARNRSNCWRLNINTDTGIIRLSRQWENSKNTSSFSCTVVANDGMNSGEANVTVKITPYIVPSSGFRFENDRYEVEIMENDSSILDGETILRLRTVGIGPDEPISFEILNDYDEDVDGSGQYFSLHRSAGILSTTDYTRTIDREVTPTISYVVEAVRVRHSNQTAARALIVVRVLDKNDNRPKMVGLPFVITLPLETKPNTTVFRVHAIDQDEGPNGIVKYSFSQSYPKLDIFNIDQDSGQITVVDKWKSMIRKDVKEFEISVVATDSGTPALSTTVPISIHLVDSFVPIFPQRSYNVSAMEGSTGVGTILLESDTFGISSPSNVVLGYTFVQENSENEHFSSHFDLHFITGRLTLQKALNRKRRPLIRLVIRIRDYSSFHRQSNNGRYWSDAVVLVHVMDYNDHVPIFNQPCYFINVTENAALNGKPLLRLQATDDDEGENARFEFSLQNRNDSHFRLDLTRILTLMKSLDYEVQRLHTLTAVVKDFGTPALSNTAKIHVFVVDTNDNPPAFSQMAFHAEIPSPKWTSGQFIGQASATDPDECDQGRLRYRIFSGNEDGLFTIDEKSGVLRTLRSSTTSTKSLLEHSLNLTVTDGIYTASCKFMIKIRSGSMAGMVKFARSMYQARVKESATPGTFVMEVRVEDEVGIQTPALRYRLIGSSLFRMEESTGKVFTARRLGPHEKALHLLTILAERWSDFTVVAHCQLQVTIISENNRPPEFLADRFFTTLVPQTKSNTIILKIRAVDQDRDDVLEYLFDSRSSSNFEEYFFLDSNTGALAVRRNLESVADSVFKVDLRVTDRGNPPRRTTSQLAVRVVSKSATASIHVVRFTQLEYIFTVPEQADIGTEIGRLELVRDTPTSAISASDLLHYRFSMITPRTSNQYIDWISLDEKNGLVQIAQHLDRELTSEVHFYASVYHTSSKEPLAMALVRVLIEDADDSKPVFENVDTDPMIVHVLEDATVGSLVTVFAASDRDSGDAGKVTYWIDTSRDDHKSVPFKIDPGTGWLTTSEALDREVRDHYTFTISAGKPASSALTSSLNVTVKIEDANDQKPTFTQDDYEFRLGDSSSTMPGFVIGRVSTTDADLPPYNEVRYFIVTGNEFGYFDIRPTGEIYVAKRPIGNTGLYRITVLATDGQFEDTAHVIIHLNSSMISCVQDGGIYKSEFPNPESPNFQMLRLTVPEDAPIGKVLGRLDALPTGYFYKETRTSQDFGITENNEVIVLKALDYEKETIQNMEIGIHTKNGDECGCPRHVTITVLDVDDCAPEMDHSSIPNEISVAENYNGTYPYLIGRLHAVDADSGAGGQVIYQLMVEDVKEDEKDVFSIESSSGAVFLWKPLDRERRDKYNLTLIAADKSHPNTLASKKNIVVKVLDVNDNPPVFVQETYDVSAPEDTPVGVVLLKVEAVSKDVGENALITYSAEKSDMFEVNKRTGEITLRQPLDYETVKEHRIVITASDGGRPPLSSTVTVKLRVLDVNDNDPVFEKRHYLIQTMENTPVGTRIIKLSATDLDGGKNGLVSYRIESSNQYFQLSDDDSGQGWITLAKSLDYERTTSNEFQVTAYDHGRPSRSSVAVVTIDVLDVNDNPPKILNCNRTLVVKALVSTTTPLMTFQVTDADGPSNGKPFHFSLVGQPMNSTGNGPWFKLDSDGTLYALKTPLELPEYYITVSVRDSGEPELSSQCRLHIRVTEESRFSPRLINTSFMVLSYMGEINYGGVVGRVLALDDDPKDSIRYSIVDVNGGDAAAEQVPSLTKGKETIFMIDPDDGRISAAAELPPGDYVLNVSATDGKFDTFSLVSVTIRSITTKMLDSAVSMRIRGQDKDEVGDEGRRRHGRKTAHSFDERTFVERHLKNLMQAVASAVNARSSQFVHVLSVQKADETTIADEINEEQSVKRRTLNRKRRSKKREDNVKAHPWKRSLAGAVDVLIAVQKSSHQDFFKPEYVRKTLEQKLDEVETKARVKVASIVTEICRPDRCKNGGICRERLHLYEMVNNAILTESFSFVSPTHKRWAECVCAGGYGGEYCGTAMNDCAKKPCPHGHTCVPKDPLSMNGNGNAESGSGVEPRGYRCICTGIGCPAHTNVHLMSPHSWIRYTLSENLETRMRFAVTFRTVARSGVLLYAGGGTDFQSLELFGGQLRYRYDLGDGETLLYAAGRPSVDDGLWHTVRLERRGRTATLTLDDREPQNTQSPGSSFVLNLHGADVSVGAGHGAGSGFVGCLKGASLNDDVLPWHGPGVRLHDVDVGGCTDEDFKRLLTSAAGVKNACGWCLNNGTCVSGSESSWSCICPAPFTGLRCESFATKTRTGLECVSSPCRNGGTCITDRTAESGYRCQCAPNYGGRTCSVYGDPCASNPCANDGICTKIGSAHGAGTGFYCNCTSAWTGPLCRHAALPSPNIVTGFLGVTIPELVGIVSIFLVLILLTVVIVLLCRRQRASKRKKYLQRRGPSTGVTNQGENEPMFSESDVTPSTFAQRSLAGNMLVSGGPCGAMVVVSDPNSVITPMSPAACSAPGAFGNGSSAPPPLPPRSRGFQPHRGSKLSNLESALSTGIPTVQVRPLSMHDRQASPVEGGLARAGLESAANYGSAAEELERLGRRTSPTLDDLEDWKAALNRMNADSLEKLKVAAGISDDQWMSGSCHGPFSSEPSAGAPSSTGDNASAPVAAGRRRLPEEERSNGTYQWDYSDWNSTLGQNGGGPRQIGPYATLSHLSVATDDEYGNETLPRGVCRLEETDSEYAANESENEHDSERKESSRLRGDEFTKEIMALTRSFGRKRMDTGGSEDESSSSRPILSTFKNDNGKSSYIDRYLPRPIEPPNSSASERKLLLSHGAETNSDEAPSTALDQLSDDDNEEYTTPSAVFDSSLLDPGKLSDIGGHSSDGERSTDSVVMASGSGGVKREDSTLIVCSISDDDQDENAVEEEEKQKRDHGNVEDVGNYSGNSENVGNKTFLKRPKKQTQV